ncbi:hypothetical protein [Ramlibacter humi]|uniref:Uncharacterized protein n=1 Tax=Ramlibacter humi TaxID=2530451 RepID=A0A4Z0BQ06_9BURK|nr:hypothetical protein [Ramlibacter humi]TFZ00069.1 hypothetical protein EZ216_13235 [Ramlibacter humi]
MTAPGVVDSVSAPAHATRNPPSGAAAAATWVTSCTSSWTTMGEPTRLPAASVSCAITRLLRVVEPWAIHSATLPPPASLATAPGLNVIGLAPTRT